MVKLYSHIVDADLDTADAITAELVKTAENAYRDVQIAFANEVALICEAAGGDVWRVRELVNKVPFRNMHLPGAGVGGHCIPKDPWLLASAASQSKPARLIPQTRAVNDSMPLHVAGLTIEALEEANVKPEGARVVVLGYAYLANSDDARNSPSVVLVNHLEDMGVRTVVHDPWIPGFQGEVLDKIKGCDAIILMVAHDEYQGIDLAQLKKALRTPVLVDGRHFFNRKAAGELGFFFRGVGQSPRV